MGIKIYNPTTPGRRQTSVSTFEEITKGKPEKKLIKIKKRTGGRNFYGKITVRHRGGGAKQFYRLIDYKQDKFDLAGKVEAIEYDPNRQARIALVQYEDGEKRYIIAPTELKVGETVLCSKNPIEIKVGNRLPIEHIPLGILIYNIEITPGKGGQLVRTAGGAAKLMAIEGDYATIAVTDSGRGMSQELLKKRVEVYNNTGADTVITSCLGCMMYLSSGMKGRNVFHIIELMEQAVCP